MKILDTDHCIEILRGKLNVEKKIKPGQELAIASISVAELTHGAHRSSRPEANLASLDVFLAALTVLPFDEFSARRFGALKADMERAGTPMDNLDLQIASIVMEHNAVLVTHNRRHFQRLPDLKLEDWLD